LKDLKHKEHHIPLREKGILWGLLLFVLVFLSFLPVLNAGFVWDDDALTQNPLLYNMRGLKAIWLKPSAIPREAHYWPLVYTSFWIEYHIWGLRPVGYHLVNVLIHGFNVILIWIILKRMRVPFAWFVAALFALHPVHVESVAWVIERKDVLSGFFYFLSFFYFIKFHEAKKNPAYMLSLFFFLCGMWSKSIVISLPLALLLYLWWKGEKIDLRKTFYLAPYFILALLLVLFDMWIYRHKSSASFPFTFPERFIIAGKALWFYAGKIFWPYPLMAIYPAWEIKSYNAVQYLYPLTALLLPLGLFLLQKSLGITPLILVLFFGITLFPVLGFVDYGYMRYAFAADRFQYLASLGLIIFFSAVLQRLQNTSLLKGKSFLIYGTMSLVLIVLGYRSFRQAETFRDYETLFRHNVEKNPHSYAVHNNLATALEEKGDLRGAENHYKKALELKPDEDQVHYNLAALYAKTKKEDKAVYHYKQAILINPENASAHNNLGFLFALKGDLDKAINHYKIALKIKPDHFRTNYNMGNALMLKGDVNAAVGYYKRALEMDPGSSDLANTLAWILATNKDPEIRNGKDAVLYAEMACKGTGYKEASLLDTLAAAYAEAGRFPEAARTAQKAIERAEASGDKSLLGEMKKRLQLYQSGKAYHESK